MEIRRRRRRRACTVRLCVFARTAECRGGGGAIFGRFVRSDGGGGGRWRTVERLGLPDTPIPTNRDEPPPPPTSPWRRTVGSRGTRTVNTEQPSERVPTARSCRAVTCYKSGRAGAVGLRTIVLCYSRKNYEQGWISGSNNCVDGHKLCFKFIEREWERERVGNKIVYRT